MYEPNSKISRYKISRIPKGNGKFREIYIPGLEDSKMLRSIIPELESILKELDIYRANYAFQKGRNCSLNALQHIGFRYTISMDLVDFFNSIQVSHVANLIPAEIIAKCFVGGSPKQGLPTSPMISNIAFLRCDKEIIVALRKLLPRFVYTRYADDLIVSFDNFSDVAKITFVLKQISEQYGFEINPAKTKLQDGNNGSIIVTGIAINKDGLAATRKTKRKIRAAKHQKNKTSESGLVEWSKCKLPKVFTTIMSVCTKTVPCTDKVF
jgi:hypothetical protein